MEILRSLLFVPADSPRKMDKARSLRPDAFIFDLEDAVAPASKPAARKMLLKELEEKGPFPSPVFVRVNSAKTDFFKDDLEAAVNPSVNGLVLPKSDDPVRVAGIGAEISRLEQKCGMIPEKIKLVLILETALGVARAFDLAQCCPRVIGMSFGAEDYCADIGVNRSKDGAEVAFPRAWVALQARARGLHAIDTVFTDIRDDAGFASEISSAKSLGYTGKALIHPDQIAWAHRGFAPSESEVSWAKRVIAAYEAAKSAGIGVVTVDEKMIDEPILTQARKVVRQHEISS